MNEEQHTLFDKCKVVFGSFLVEFMSRVSKNEVDFLQMAYHIRVKDGYNIKDPYKYTVIILQFLNDPFFERIILSNIWDKSRKQMVVDPECSHTL